MRTTKDSHGIDRLIPETPLEKSLLAIAIRAALDEQPVRVGGIPEPGSISVRDEWDNAGRLLCRATVIAPEEPGQTPLDWSKCYNFHAYVINYADQAKVAWEGPKTRENEPPQSGIVPSLPVLFTQDMQ